MPVRNAAKVWLGLLTTLASTHPPRPAMMSQPVTRSTSSLRRARRRIRVRLAVAVATDVIGARSPHLGVGPCMRALWLLTWVAGRRERRPATQERETSG